MVYKRISETFLNIQTIPEVRETTNSKQRNTVYTWIGLFYSSLLPQVPLFLFCTLSLGLGLGLGFGLRLFQRGKFLFELCIHGRTPPVSVGALLTPPLPSQAVH